MRKAQNSTFVQQLWMNLLEILFPAQCCSCGRPQLDARDQSLCRRCAARVSYVVTPLCPVCGTGLSRDGGDQNRWCRACLQQLPPFDCARSLLYYGDPARTLLHRLKFKADTRVVPALRTLAEAGGNWLVPKNYDLIVPVPLFPARLKKRGLNQALVLARLLFAEQKLKIDPTALIKIENTPAQSELNGPERRKNLLGSIVPNPKRELTQKCVCLVDDIFTTGATVTECSSVLKRQGAATVDVVTFARA